MWKFTQDNSFLDSENICVVFYINPWKQILKSKNGWIGIN